jgi:hypothetical protein
MQTDLPQRHRGTEKNVDRMTGFSGSDPVLDTRYYPENPVKTMFFRLLCASVVNLVGFDPFASERIRVSILPRWYA